MIKFNKYYVVNTESKLKAKVFYSMDNRTDSKKCVTIFAKDYNNCLSEMFKGNYSNYTNSMVDLFDKGNVDLFEDSPYYKEARIRAELNEIANKKRQAVRRAKHKAQYEARHGLGTWT